MQDLLASRHALLIGIVLAGIGAFALVYTLGARLMPALSVYADFAASAALCFLIWAAYEWAVPYDTWKTIYEERNLAAAVLAVGVLLALALIATAT